MQRDTLTECLRWREFPVTTIGVYTPDYDLHWEVAIETAVGCGLSAREVVRVCSSRREAEAFIASEYGITAQALDGADAWAGWWLS